MRGSTTQSPTASVFLAVTWPSTWNPCRRRSLRSTRRSSRSTSRLALSQTAWRTSTLACTRLSARTAHKPTEMKKPADLTAEKRDGGIRYTDEDGNAKFINRRRRTLQQRKNRVQQKKDHVLNTLAGDDEEEED